MWVTSFICIFGLVWASHAQSNDELHECTELVFQVDDNSFPDDEIVYDREGDRLFVSVNEGRFSTGTYPSFLNLLASYNPRLGVEDMVPDGDVQDFLEALMTSTAMTTLEGCLLDWGLITDSEDFRSKVEQYWFMKYSRSGGAEDSSGFEHVFQGELREDGAEVTGMHGWVYTYLSEQEGEFMHGQSDADCADNLIQINNFEFYGGFKSISSIWIGKSPELQMALYTVCFMTRFEQNCNIEVDGGRAMTIVNFGMSGVSPDTIGTAYPQC